MYVESGWEAKIDILDLVSFSFCFTFTFRGTSSTVEVGTTNEGFVGFGANKDCGKGYGNKNARANAEDITFISHDWEREETDRPRSTRK
jgi:hypothetical protein